VERLTWWRSWPHPDETRAAGRAHVIDDLPRLVMRDGDYATVEGGLPTVEPGVFLLEWDVALGLRERTRFEEIALTEPHRVLVAPYDIHPVGQGPTVVHKVCPDPAKPGMRWPVAEGDPVADSFGFGCIYLPQAVLARWPASKSMRDSTFSDWHIATVGRARVTWAVHPQHLHGD
jgi:hypothetical protein